jgi:hypothetical protein
VEDWVENPESSTAGSFGIEGNSKGESEVKKLLQEPDGSLYIVIREEGEERRFTARPSEATILHCGARLAVSGPILRKSHSALHLVVLQDGGGRVVVVVLQMCHAVLQTGVWAVSLHLVNSYTTKVLGHIAVSGLATSLQ